MHRRARRSRTDFGFHFLIAIAVPAVLDRACPRSGADRADPGRDQGLERRGPPRRHGRGQEPRARHGHPDHHRQQGRVPLPGAEAGQVRISARMEGLAPAKTPPVDLLLGQIKQVELALSVGAATAEIKVTGEAPLIDVKQSGSSVSLRDELIEKLPRGRNFDSVLTLAPGSRRRGQGGRDLDRRRLRRPRTATSSTARHHQPPDRRLGQEAGHRLHRRGPGQVLGLRRRVRRRDRRRGQRHHQERRRGADRRPRHLLLRSLARGQAAPQPADQPGHRQRRRVRHLPQGRPSIRPSPPSPSAAR